MKFLLLVIMLPLAALCQSHNPAPYCLDHVGQYRTGTLITNVTFNTLNYSASTNISQANSDSVWFGYNYYSNIPSTTVHTDSAYVLSVSFDHAPLDYQPVYYSVWIDYDHNSYFDSTETVMTNAVLGTLPATAATKAISVTIPHNAYVGTTRMRVLRREEFAYFGNNHLLFPCNPTASDSYGNIQDYDIQITDTVPPPDTTTYVPALSIQAPSVYPNPSSGVFYIGNEKIDLSGYPTGLYIRRVGDRYYKLSKY